MFKHKVYQSIKNSTGKQYIFKFKNGYGASVVKSLYTYGGKSGLYELAVVSFEGEWGQRYRTNYSTKVANDVVGWLDIHAVNKLLDKISEL